MGRDLILIPSQFIYLKGQEVFYTGGVWNERVEEPKGGVVNISGALYFDQSIWKTLISLFSISIFVSVIELAITVILFWIDSRHPKNIIKFDQ